MGEPRIIAVKERSEEDGSSWLETKVFSSSDPISKVLDWANNYNSVEGWKYACRYGRLMITVERALAGEVDK